MQLRVRAVLLVALAFASPSWVPGSAQDQPVAAFREPRDMAGLVAAAAKEGVLDVAWAQTYGGADGAREIQEHIERIYHIALQIRYAPVANGAAFETQVAQEVRSAHVASSDVLFHVRDADLAAATQPVDFRRYVPAIRENQMYFGKRAVVVATALQSFAYNTRLVPPDRVPQSFADLLKPEWKGKIASTTYQGLFGNYLGLSEMMGHDGMLAFYIHPREGTAIAAFAPGIPLTAAHPAAARLFIAYLLTAGLKAAPVSSRPSAFCRRRWR